MSTSAFGGDLRLINQVVLLASKFGDAEQTLKALASDRELLAYILDYVAFNHGRSFTVRDANGASVEVRLVCFSETSSVPNDEVNQRVERFGRYVTEKELEQLFNMLKGADAQYGLCYPIVTHTIPLLHRATLYEYMEIRLRSLSGRIEFGNADSGDTRYNKTGMIWAPATFFAVVPRLQQNRPVLSSRPKLEE